MKRYIVVLTALFSISAHAEETGLDGLHGIVVSNLTFQKANNDMLRGLKAPTYENGNVNINPVIADSSGRLQNAFIVNYTKNKWTVSLDYLDLRTIGDAYSLTNPFSFGVNTFESDHFPNSIKTVNALSGIYELNLSYNNKNNSFIIGKVDTSLYYLADPVFAGDLTNGVDYANAATRVVAPPFPSIAVVAKHQFSDSNWSVTGIVGDSFGDRESLNAGKNISNGDLSYVVEANYYTSKRHFQITLNHVDSFNKMDKGITSENPAVNAAVFTVSDWVTDDIALFSRVGMSNGDAQVEDLNVLVGTKYNYEDWSLIASQSATRVAVDSMGGNSRKGDYTFVTEAILNYNIDQDTSFAFTYDHYGTSGSALLDKDGGIGGKSSNNVFGIRLTHFYKF
ncbi:hypothetical protein C942_04034 [Photobacterium marinum]|uniref:Porin domain-containing protein n=1 Tax=Photobacterium marinum TaxID=1056511 RepID=L8J6H4_9GAMM|nr:hypothetical protein [Photobacterium marinum]ELR63199.1 hypothetical protein C942_04034 [Photobacterium marinum]